ncbi:MAG: hypothetical protein KAJ19_24090 [Gammaproteobacteria bacterium]|nr:hypothetical protein [Gammaproteobacteria bacterium]
MSNKKLEVFLKELMCLMFPRGIMVSELKPRLKGTAFSRYGEKAILSAVEELKRRGLVKLYARGASPKAKPWVRATPEAIKTREVSGCKSETTH